MNLIRTLRNIITLLQHLLLGFSVSPAMVSPLIKTENIKSSKKVKYKPKPGYLMWCGLEEQKS